MALSGCDVSKWQPDGVPNTAFVMMKATQGVSEVDPEYYRRLSECRSAKKLIGSYHYADGGDPYNEAHYYVTYNKRVEGELQALDFESSPGVLTVADPVGWALNWCKAVESLTNNKPLIYMSGNTAQSFDWARLISNNNGLWLASWQNTPPSPAPWPFFIMWQNSDNGNIYPFTSGVDTDIFYGDSNTWALYGKGMPTMTNPVPLPTQGTYAGALGFICRRSDSAVFVVMGGKIHHVTDTFSFDQYIASKMFVQINLSDADINGWLAGQ